MQVLQWECVVLHSLDQSQTIAPSIPAHELAGTTALEIVARHSGIVSVGQGCTLCLLVMALPGVLCLPCFDQLWELCSF